MQRLVGKRNSILMFEHNFDLICYQLTGITNNFRFGCLQDQVALLRVFAVVESFQDGCCF